MGNQAVLRMLGPHAAPAKDTSRKRLEDEPEKTKAEKVDAAKAAAALRGFSLDVSMATHLAQRDPPDAGVAPPVVPAPPGRATINYLPKLMDLAPGGDWGVTTEDDVVIDVSAYTSATDWKVKITTADQQAHQGVHRLPGVDEVTPALVSGTKSCRKLRKMSKSLKDVADQKAHSGFYMLAAVQAHEDLHITQYRADLDPAYTTFRTAVEALTVPLAAHADAASARTAIKALPAYTAALAALHAADVAANNKTANHTNMASFKAAEHTVVDPMIATIRARRTALKCK